MNNTFIDKILTLYINFKTKNSENEFILINPNTLDFKIVDSKQLLNEYIQINDTDDLMNVLMFNLSTHSLNEQIKQTIKNIIKQNNVNLNNGFKKTHHRKASSLADFNDY